MFTYKGEKMTYKGAKIRQTANCPVERTETRGLWEKYSQSAEKTSQWSEDLTQRTLGKEP